jgi:GT2 family glycosyltransferase
MASSIPTNDDRSRLGVVIVAFGHEDTIRRLLDRIGEEKEPGDAVVLVDNHPEHLCAEIADRHPAADTAIRSENIGFGAACNLGVESLGPNVDLLLFLNPDTYPLPGALEAIRRAHVPEWAGWMPLLVTPDGVVNSAGNVLHLSGLSWVGGLGKPVSAFAKPCEVPLLSGACAVIRKQVWDEVGGFSDMYFVYFEDADLSIRMRLRGYKLGLLPDARIEHDYAFDRGSTKWFYEERNRYILILRTWPLSVIVVLLPVLFAIEIGLWMVAIGGRRGTLKLKSTVSFLRTIPKVCSQRRSIQRTRAISAREFLEIIESRMDTPLVGAFGRFRLLNFAMTRYYAAARWILSLFSRRSRP